MSIEKNENSDPVELLENEEMHSFNMPVSSSFYDRLDKHLYLLRTKRQERISKKTWILEAILEKLQDEENQSPAVVCRTKNLGFSIPKSVSDRIKRTVDVLVRLGKRYSKKKWVMDALEKKYDREQSDLNSWVDSLKDDKLS